jgi:DNA-binding winged helix-turn-helix (wHTH) protein
MESKTQQAGTATEQTPQTKDISGGHPSTGHNSDTILFGEFSLVPARRTFARQGQPIQLGSRAYEILVALVERAGQVVQNAELLSIVWPKIFVQEATLRVHIANLRRALGHDRSGANLIVNVPGRGYTFVGSVERISGGENTADLVDSVGSDNQEKVSVPSVKIVALAAAAPSMTASNYRGAGRYRYVCYGTRRR